MSIRGSKLVHIVLFVFTAMFIWGCDGDDGAPGPAGPAGTDGSDGQACWDLNGNGIGDIPDEDTNGDGVVDVDDCRASPPVAETAIESCSLCHDSGQVADAAVAHTLPPIEAISNITVAVNGADIDVTFDLQADGVLTEGYDQVQRGYRNDGGTRTDVCNAPSRSDPCDPASMTLTDNGNGNYTIKVLGEAAAAAINNRWLFRVGAGSDRETRVYFYADTPASPFPADVSPVAHSAEACAACHGPEGIDVHGGYYAAVDGGEPCLVCHGSDESDDPEVVPALFQVVHGYHSSIWEDDGEVIEVTYPTYMNNCSVCHEEGDFLTAANSMPVNADACFSCHGSTETMFAPDDPLYVGLHDGFTGSCESCHAVGQIAEAYQVVTDVHNGLITERDGVIWQGLDTSVTEGARIEWTITGVADDGTDLTITWQANYDGVGVDPCNAVAGPTAPVFFADGEGNLSILRNYAQGQDFILGTNPDAAGQPGSAPEGVSYNVSADNTTCAGNVATTVVPVEETDAMYGRVAIQGKPRVPNIDPDPDPDFADEYGTLMPVRAFTPTYDWVVGTGGAMDPPRRAVVDSSLCTSCHVGSMYQHGGNRVDNVDMCYLCHNSAANDEYVRVDTFGVDSSESYDGRAGQAFGIREMLHAVHPAGATGNPIVIYRGRGIYAWADDVSKLNNWPTGESDCTDRFGRPGHVVAGADDPAATSACQVHTFHAPTYPRGLYDCAACHVEGVDLVPDTTRAMATTVEAGAPRFGDQINDVLEGVQTNSCVTCHADGFAKNHAYQNGWTPQVFQNGRQTIIDSVR